MRCPSSARTIRAQSGFTLTELLIVVVILALGASIALPSLAPSEDARLKKAARLFADAVTFARSEAIRTGKNYGVRVEQGNQRIRVYELREGLFFDIPTYSVRDPLSLSLYDYRLDAHPEFRGISLTDVDLTFSNSGTLQEYLGFNGDGVPKYTAGSRDYDLVSGSFTLALDSRQKIVQVAPVTGRVTIQ